MPDNPDEGLDFDELEQLMQENGSNHGRSRGEGGAWIPLDGHYDAESRAVVANRAEDREITSRKRYVDKPRKHGTAYAYVKIKCRCVPCQAWNADRVRRLRDVTTSE